MSHKEDDSNKVPCPVCGKMISEKMGRAVHIKSKFHQDALKGKGVAEPEVKPPVVKETPEVKPPVVKETPEVKPPVNSGIAGKDKPPEEEKKSGGGLGKFLEKIFGDDDDDW